MSHHLAVGETGPQPMCAHNRNVCLNDVHLSGVNCNVHNVECKDEDRAALGNATMTGD